MADSVEKIGKIFVAVEAIKMSDELIATADDANVPLSKYVQPKFRVYQYVSSANNSGEYVFSHFFSQNRLQQVDCVVLGITRI